MNQVLQPEPRIVKRASGAPGDIMIVDDNPANLKLLEQMLSREGHQVRSFPRGRLALAAAAKNPPDLILLDINMPEMGGYEVCERLKSDPGLSPIPVIFLSALNEIPDKIRAFRAGGVDYVAKPFQFDEVRARVETHLSLHQLRRNLEQQNEHLEQVVAARTRQLAEANERLTILDHSKNEFLALISHELRTPLNGVLGVAEIVLQDVPPGCEKRELQDMFGKSRQRLLSILDDALLLTEIDVDASRFPSGPVPLRSILDQAIESVADFAASRMVSIAAPAGEAAIIAGNERLMVRAFRALLETAIKFSDPCRDVRILLESDDAVRVAVETFGMTIPEPEVPKFFSVFSINEASTAGGELGLGPAIADRILALFGAKVTVSNRQAAGIELCVTLHRETAKLVA